MERLVFHVCYAFFHIVPTVPTWASKSALLSAEASEIEDIVLILRQTLILLSDLHKPFCGSSKYFIKLQNN